MELLPLGVRQVLIVGTDDDVMPVIAPTSTAWPTVRDKVVQLLKEATATRFNTAERPVLSRIEPWHQ